MIPHFEIYSCIIVEVPQRIPLFAKVPNIGPQKKTPKSLFLASVFFGLTPISRVLIV